MQSLRLEEYGSVLKIATFHGYSINFLTASFLIAAILFGLLGLLLLFDWLQPIAVPLLRTDLSVITIAIHHKIKETQRFFKFLPMSL